MEPPDFPGRFNLLAAESVEEQTLVCVPKLLFKRWADESRSAASELKMLIACLTLGQFVDERRCATIKVIAKEVVIPDRGVLCVPKQKNEC
jgi:hypothetical protein